MSAELEITGMSELIEQIERLGASIEEVSDAGLKKGANIILKDAKNTTAFRDKSGKLRQELKLTGLKKDKKTGERYILVGQFKRDLFYGRMVEFGTSNMDAHPFLVPALERNTSEIIEVLKQSVREGIDNATK